jgi:2-polyprenyl-3-methyl-5-hydroxy-6-metoxy-1,4-benzoquinol methylase
MSDQPAATDTLPTETERRARETKGGSAAPIYRLAARVLAERPGGTLLDVGCGTGNLWSYVSGEFDRYVGADVVRYDGFPESGEFFRVDMDTGRIPMDDGSADTVVSVETIEHVENPRAFFRELARLVRPGGRVVVTTPNQLSALSFLTLHVKGHFQAFAERPGLYPAHITALLEIDLLRIAKECGLIDARIRYTDSGRIPGTPRHWPRPLRGRLFSDNLLLEARRP